MPAFLHKEEEYETMFAKNVRQGSVAWWGDPTSGCPSTLEETCCYLLDSGFTPQQCYILSDKLKEVVRSAVNKYVLNYKISVPQSCEGFVIPGGSHSIPESLFRLCFGLIQCNPFLTDPHNVLRPGEVFIKSSGRLVSADGSEVYVIVGDFLVSPFLDPVPGLCYE